MSADIHTDVIVVGGGAAGVAAACGAAGAGVRVVLAEKDLFLGGVATAAEVGTVCGLYAFRKDEVRYIAGAFARDFAERLKKASGTEPISEPSGLHYLPYRIEAFRELCHRLLDEQGVTRLRGELQGVAIAGEKIGALTVQAAGEPATLTAAAFVDCTGDAVLSRLAGSPVIRSDRYQAAAQVFRMDNVTAPDETRLGFALMKALQSAIREKKLPPHFDRVYLVPGSLRDGGVSLKIGIPRDVTGEAENRLALKQAAEDFIGTLAVFLVGQVAAFRHARLSHIAPDVGIRVGARMRGRYLLTEEDVLGGKKFDDAVANSSWPIEEWGQDKRVSLRYLKENDLYQIPARCLVSATIGNLFAAGRCLSATDAAIASARVMGVCLQTGHAAGHLAATLSRPFALSQGEP